MGKKEVVAKDLREALCSYVNEVINAFVMLVPNILIYSVYWEEEEVNEKGSYFSVVYEPCMYYARFYVFKGLFDEIPEAGLTDSFKEFLKYCIAHEVAHCLLWGLEGRYEVEEKAATLVGSILFRLFKHEVKHL